MSVRTIDIQTTFGDAQGHAARHVLGKLHAAGYEAYLVGGCVRDACMGQPIHDYDIATAAVPSQVMALFERCFPTGLAHGTVTVKTMGHLFEVTTFRTEAGYTDHRHPDHVAFVAHIQEDLARRDFTINAMAIGCDGVVIDPYGGYDDVQAKQLRAVGEADVRFAEDPLRMMRGIRLAAQYALKIESHTWQAIIAQRTRLRWIAMERVYAELQRMVAGEHPWRALTLLAQSGLLAQCKHPLPLPLSLGVRHDDPATDPLAFLPTLGDVHSRWALWLIQMDIHEESFGVFMRALCVSNAFRLAMRQILAVHATVGIAVGDASDEQRQWHHTVLAYGGEAVERWLDVAHVLVQTQTLCAVRTPYAVHGKRWLTAMPLTQRHQLAMDGTFLLRMSGCASGKWVGACLDQMTWEVVQGNVINDRVHIAHHAFVWIETAGRVYGIKPPPSPDNVRILPLEQHGLAQRLYGTRYIGNMHVYESIDSTQRMAKCLARQGCPDGTIVLAEEQTDGRGTYAKTWYSPKQSALSLSVVLRPTPHSPDGEWATLNLVLAVAVCHALKATTGLPVQIKWPNDLLIDGRKVCGMLSETVDKGAYWIAGIGVNVHLDYATVPATLHATIGCLHHATRIHAAMQHAPTVASAWTRHDVLVAILQEIDVAVPQWEREGFAPFRSLWQQLAYTVGRTVTLQHNGQTIRGVATGVSATGHLCVIEERTGETVQVSSVRQLCDKMGMSAE